MGNVKTKDQPAAADEITPLLAASSQGPTLQANEETLVINGDVNGNGKASVPHQEDVDEDKPLPRGQILMLCFARMIEPMAFFCIFPFVNQMIEDNGDVAETDVGFYSGVIESLFSLTQMCTMLVWGRLADRYGRKPVLVTSLFGLSVTVCLFGFSKAIWQMILFRCLAGVFSGSVVTIRVMFQELSTPKTQARAYSFFAFFGNLGIFIGPILGGSLSNLPRHYPDTFGNNKFLNMYPYSLGPIVTGGGALLASIFCMIIVKETLASDHGSKKGSNHPMSIWEILKSKGVPFVLYVFGFVSIQGFAYTAIIPVFWFTSPANGGFGFDERRISIFLSLSGVSQAVWLLLIFPPLQRRIGTGGILKACASVYWFFYLMNIVFNWLLRNDLRNIFVVVGPCLIMIGSGVSMSFTAVQLAINDVSPSSQTLGTMNAIALTLSSALRAVIPALATSLYAVGVRYQILGGQLAWVVLAISTIILAISLRWYPANAESKLHLPKPKVDEESNRNTEAGHSNGDGNGNGNDHGNGNGNGDGNGNGHTLYAGPRPVGAG